MTDVNSLWTIWPDTAQPVRYSLVCEKCAERSEPDDDPGVTEVWALAHSQRHPSHTRYCAEVTRY